MGFLTTFYKYIIQQYFTVTAPHSVFSQYLKQIKYQMLVVVHPQSDEREATMGFLTTFYKYIIQQYFTVTAPHSVLRAIIASL